MNIATSPLTLDQLVAAIEQEAAVRGRSPLDQQSDFQRAAMAAAATAGRGHGAYYRLSSFASAEEFLPLYGPEFVDAAYRTLLFRPAEAGTMESRLADLLTGRRTRWEMLLRIRLSGEGRSKGARIRGLYLAAATSLAYRIPLLGAVLAMTAWLLRLPPWLQDRGIADMTMEAQVRLLQR
jgi:hypothetical protein